MSNTLKSVAILLLFAVIVDSRCRSADEEEMSGEEFGYCWHQFCTCNQFDNCSLIGQPLDDILVLLYLRMNIILCGKSFPKIYEPGGYPFDLRITADVKTNVLIQFIVTYKTFTKKDYLKRENPDEGYPPPLINHYWGYGLNTSSLLKGHFYFSNSYKTLLTEDNKNTEMDPVYIRLTYSVRLKDKFADNETEREDLGGTELVGPFGKKAFKGKTNTRVFMAFPLFNTRKQLAIKLTADQVVMESDFVQREAYQSFMTGDLKQYICVGKTVDRSGKTFWTSQGCRPILQYNQWQVHSFYNLFWTGSVLCMCDWIKNPPSNSILSHSSNESIGTTVKPNKENQKKLPKKHKKRNAFGLVLGWILLFFSSFCALFFTILLVLAFIE